jgi:hypothetical protein
MVRLLDVGCLPADLGLYFLALLICVVGDTPAFLFYFFVGLTVHLSLGTDRYDHETRP